MSIKNNNRVSNLAADQAMIDGIQKHQAKLPQSFPMEGQQQTLAGVTTVFTDRVTTGKAVVEADNAHTAAVQTDRTKRAQTRGIALAFKRLLIALFAQDPAVLGDFAIKAPKPRTQTTASKATAAEKAKATRTKLGTKGTRQKKQALAVSAASGSAPASPAAAAASPAAQSAAPAAEPAAPTAPEKAAPAPAPVAAPAKPVS